MTNALLLSSIFAIACTTVGCMGDLDLHRKGVSSIDFIDAPKRGLRPIPLLDAPNLVIWEKDLDDERTLAIERAYVYPSQASLKNAAGVFQYAFVLINKTGPKPRSVKWVRNIPEESFIGSGYYPDPQLQILDISMVGDDLLLLFNQYIYCFAYRISLSDLGQGKTMTVPTSDETSALARPDKGYVGFAMHEGKIQLVRGEVILNCRDANGWHSFTLQPTETNVNMIWVPKTN